MTNQSHLFRDKLKKPGYLSQFDVARIRKIADEASEQDFEEHMSCSIENAKRILHFWEIAQIELWDAEILKNFFHPWIYADRDLVAARIQAAMHAKRLPPRFSPKDGLRWLEDENVLIGMMGHWVKANARLRPSPQQDQGPSPAPAKPLQRAPAQDAAILAAIQQAGHDPLSLPKGTPGKPGVKAAIRAMLVGENPLFHGEVFDKAWERLRKHGEIADRH